MVTLKDTLVFITIINNLFWRNIKCGLKKTTSFPFSSVFPLITFAVIYANILFVTEDNTVVTPKSNTIEFIRKAQAIYGDKYDYGKVEYKGNKEKTYKVGKIPILHEGFP
mgnify:CR=1 FL=1